MPEDPRSSHHWLGVAVIWNQRVKPYTGHQAQQETQDVPPALRAWPYCPQDAASWPFLLRVAGHMTFDPGHFL